jgi:anti-anti-sigma factor
MNVTNVTNFKVISRRVGDVAVLYPQGYLNNIAGENLVRECNICLEREIRKVVLNFSETDFINSIGISMLLGITEKLKDSGGTLCFTNLSKAYIDTFEMLGLARYMHIFPGENEAMRFLTGINPS